VKLATARDLLDDELLRLEERLLDIISGEFELVSTMASRLVAAGGKRLRAILVLLAARGEGGDDEPRDRAVEVAAVCELVHLATLIHDDVIDQATTRRGVPTIHTELGNQITVLMGDHLYARAIRHLITSTGRADLVRILASTVADLCEGEIRQLNETRWLGRVVRPGAGGGFAVRFEPMEREYLEIIARKTAGFFGACGEMGALLAGGAETTARMRGYGFNLGMAFQITDDLMDYAGVREVTGKDEGNDLAAGRLTLPLIHGLHHDEHGRELLGLLSLGGGGLRKRVAELLDRTGSLGYATRVARGYAKRAREIARSHPHPEVGPVLVELAEEVLGRKV
jgi:geranylgeranyl pyrophosphate synthase